MNSTKLNKLVCDINILPALSLSVLSSWIVITDQDYVCQKEETKIDDTSITMIAIGATPLLYFLVMIRYQMYKDRFNLDTIPDCVLVTQAASCSLWILFTFMYYSLMKVLNDVVCPHFKDVFLSVGLLVWTTLMLVSFVMFCKSNCQWKKHTIQEPLPKPEI